METRWEFVYIYIILGTFGFSSIPENPIALEVAWIGHTLFVGIFFIIKAINNTGVKK